MTGPVVDPVTTARGAERGLVRAIGPWALGANAINLTVGAGIFALPAVAAGILGPAAVLAYVVCGILILLVLACYVEVGTQVTRSGGAIAYIEEAFGPLAGFLAFTVYAVGYCAAADAAIAHVMLDALATAVPGVGARLGRGLALVVLFGGLAVVNVRGVRQGTRVSVATTVAKLLPLLGLVALGITAVHWPNVTWSRWPSLAELGASTLVLFFAFSGAEAALTPSGEIRDPARTVPRGMLGGAAVVVLLYLALQVVTQGVLGPDQVAASTAPLADLGQRVAGSAGRGLIVACTAVAVFGTLAADMICTPRAFFAVSESGMLPQALSRVHARFQTPWVAILVFAVLTLLLSLSGGFRALAVLASMALLLVYLAVCLAALRMRYTRARSPGSFRAPGGPTIPLAASAVVIWVLAQSTRREVLAMLAIVAASVLYYLIRRRTVIVPAIADG